MKPAAAGFVHAFLDGIKEGLFFLGQGLSVVCHGVLIGGMGEGGAPQARAPKGPYGRGSVTEQHLALAAAVGVDYNVSAGAIA